MFPLRRRIGLRGRRHGDSLDRRFADGGDEVTQPGLFGPLPESASPEQQPQPAGKARLREPVRDQIELRAMDLDSLIADDHPARLIWAYVERLDLSALEDAIKSREGHPGGPAAAPRLLLGLWLYATSQGIGSARALARLCESDAPYRWMCGGVSMNHHTLGDFRVDHADFLDRLLAEHIAALAAAELIDLSSMSQDGIKVRAAAGASSFRRRKTLEQHLSTAQDRVARLKAEVDDDPAACSKRVRAARERAAREKSERVEAALRELGRVEAVRKKREKKNRNQTEKQKEPRASTTDPEARNMKMADGGFRPAFNVQVASVAGEQIVVAVDPGNVGSDRGLAGPMLEQLHERTGALPDQYFADGGFAAAKDIEWAHGQGVAIYAPPTKSKHGTDPFAPRKDDGPGVLAWRERMGSHEGKTLYKTRAVCECIHARWRNWSLIRFNVRGLRKVRAVMLWHALANNILQGARLMREAASRKMTQPVMVAA
jgi:transposase